MPRLTLQRLSDFPNRRLVARNGVDYLCIGTAGKNLLPGAQNIVDVTPQGTFLSSPVPMGRPALAYCIPAWLMLRVVVSSGDDKLVLGPNDVVPQVKTTTCQRVSYHHRKSARVPDIRDISREKRPGFAPIGAVVIQHLSFSDLYRPVTMYFLPP